jgi:hypothetical protein
VIFFNLCAARQSLRKLLDSQWSFETGTLDIFMKHNDNWCKPWHKARPGCGEQCFSGSKSINVQLVTFYPTHINENLKTVIILL